MTLAVSFWALVVFATGSCLFMAWSLGANSNSPPFAPAIGANAVSTMRAAFLIGILAAAGALTQGGAISETIGADLIDGVAITPLGATTGLLVAASFMSFGVYSGYPVPAAFATTGAMVGVGLSLGGDPVFGTYRRIALFWVLVPPVSGGLAYLTATILRRDDIPETDVVPLLAAVCGGVVGPATPVTPPGLDVSLLPPGWGPALVYGGTTVAAVLMPAKLLGYGALVYLLYGSLAEASRAGLAGLLGLFSCVSCSFPILAGAVAAVVGGGSFVAALATGVGYGPSTAVFLVSVALLWWRPGFDTLRAISR